MAHWDGEQNKVVGNQDIRLCCVRVKTGAQADREETASVMKGEEDVKKLFAEATGGVGGFLGNVITFGGVNRAGNAGEGAAIQVIHNRVPGVTARVVKSMQCTIPFGIAIMVFAAYLANTQELDKDNQNYFYLGVPFGAYFAYSPAINEESAIANEAKEAGASAGALFPNLCTIQ